MIYVSFKILQPELFALTNNIDVQPPPDEQPHIQPPALAEDVMNHKNMALDEVHMNNKDSQQLGLSVQKVIKQMVEEYKVDMNYSLDYGQSPWDIAAQWVTAKELIPEYAPELGECYLTFFSIMQFVMLCTVVKGLVLIILPKY